MSWLPASEEAQATSKADEVEATSEQARRAEDEDTTSETLEVRARDDEVQVQVVKCENAQVRTR